MSNGSDGNARRKFKRPGGINFAGEAARTSRRLHGAPEERQTRRQKRAAKKARQRA